MKKVLRILEKNVQWATLVIGALFLFYMVWSYVFQNPAARPMGAGGDVAAPATVDRLIAEGSGATLEQDIHKANPDFRIAVPNITPPDFSAPATQKSALATAAWDSWPLDVGKLISTVGPNQGAQMVQALPVLPAMHYLDQEPLRTV